MRLMPVVAAALVDERGRVLLQRRPADKHHGGLWEFPGGKVEPGETPEAALARELEEELAVVVDPATVVPVGFASAPAGSRHLILLLYLVLEWREELRAMEADALRWVEPAEMSAQPMPPADGPLIPQLAAALAGHPLREQGGGRT